MDKRKNDEIRSAVRENYGKVAASGSAGCGCSPSSCCGTPNDVTAADISLGLGYSSEDVAAVPEGADMGLGCGVWLLEKLEFQVLSIRFVSERCQGYVSGRRGDLVWGQRHA